MTLTRREALAALGALAGGGTMALQAETGGTTSKPRYEVAAYYFPNYHVDPRNVEAHGPGWTEWELVKRAEPRFAGHRQPRIPAWGYEDESDPAVMARKIAAAADHGVGVFLYDWYWYADGPFLERGLERGFQQAPNRNRMKFAIHWANHTWINIHPAKLSRQPFHDATVQYPGQVSREVFDRVVDHVIARYFSDPCYWTIDGCPYFSIYELTSLLEGLGGIEPTREALDSFRAKTKAAGFPDLHLNAVIWSVRILPNEKAVKDPQEMLQVLGFDSLGSYVWIHHVELPTFPETPYQYVIEKAEEHWHRTVETFDLPFHPNVTMGWDSSPRTVQSDGYVNVGYPFMATVSGNTPEAFEEGLQRCRRFLESRPGHPKILTLNAWNEWTEGSYLEPDTVHGMGYLDAIKRVFGPVTS